MSSVSTTAIPGGWVERRVAVGPHTFAILAPADPDALLEELAEDAAAAPHLADPYWAKLWPAAVDLAKAIARLPLGSPGDACLELGCGSGLVGLSCLARGLRVTVSDYVPLTVELALENAARNGFAGAEGVVLDWRRPIDRSWPLVVAADVTYDRANIAPLLTTLERSLAPGGQAWLGDAGRSPAEQFAAEALRRGWSVDLFDAADLPVPAPQLGRFVRMVLRRS